jgi:hypothetical protein
LKDILKKGLAYTNWRLVQDGLTYRLGVLEVRLRAHESEQELISLVEASKISPMKTVEE